MSHNKLSCDYDHTLSVATICSAEGIVILGRASWSMTGTNDGNYYVIFSSSTCERGLIIREVRPLETQAVWAWDWAGRRRFFRRLGRGRTLEGKKGEKARFEQEPGVGVGGALSAGATTGKGGKVARKV